MGSFFVLEADKVCFLQRVHNKTHTHESTALAVGGGWSDGATADRCIFHAVVFCWCVLFNVLAWDSQPCATLHAKTGPSPVVVSVFQKPPRQQCCNLVRSVGHGIFTYTITQSDIHVPKQSSRKMDQMDRQSHTATCVETHGGSSCVAQLLDPSFV